MRQPLCHDGWFQWVGKKKSISSATWTLAKTLPWLFPSSSILASGFSDTSAGHPDTDTGTRVSYLLSCQVSMIASLPVQYSLQCAAVKGGSLNLLHCAPPRKRKKNTKSSFYFQLQLTRYNGPLSAIVGKSLRALVPRAGGWRGRMSHSKPLHNEIGVDGGEGSFADRPPVQVPSFLELQARIFLIGWSWHFLKTNNVHGTTPFGKISFPPSLYPSTLSSPPRFFNPQQRVKLWELERAVRVGKSHSLSSQLYPSTRWQFNCSIISRFFFFYKTGWLRRTHLSSPGINHPAANKKIKYTFSFVHPSSVCEIPVKKKAGVVVGIEEQISLSPPPIRSARQTIGGSTMQKVWEEEEPPSTLPPRPLFLIALRRVCKGSGSREQPTLRETNQTNCEDAMRRKKDSLFKSPKPNGHHPSVNHQILHAFPFL